MSLCTNEAYKLYMYVHQSDIMHLYDKSNLVSHRSLQLEEERIKVLSEEVKRKKSLLEEAETNYHVRLEQEVKR